MDIGEIKAKLKLTGCSIKDIDEHTFLSILPSGRMLFYLDPIKNKLYHSKEYDTINLIGDTNRARVINDRGKHGLIDIYGNEIINPVYMTSQVYGGQIINLNDGNTAFIFNMDGELLLPGIYRSLYSVFKYKTSYVLFLKVQDNDYAIYVIKGLKEAYRIPTNCTSKKVIQVLKYILYKNDTERNVLDVETLSVSKCTYRVNEAQDKVIIVNSAGRVLIETGNGALSPDNLVI